jgi:threonine dehydratase
MIDVLPSAADVADASARLRGWLVDTPVLESEAINRLVGRRVLLKAESLQHGGSFKLRGALNRMLRLGFAERSLGVVAYSSGNHAQAVALAAKWLKCPATIVMPSDAPKVKLAGARELGAEVVLYDREREDREQIAAGIAAERGAALVPPFDHPDVIAGQGTAALELARVARARRVELEALYVPCSGGGLIAGSVLAVRTEFPDCAVYAVEPEGYADLQLSLAADERQVLTEHPATLCDALRAPTTGAITFAINRRELAGAMTVNDAEVLDAMALALMRLKVVLEPSGAAALAAVIKAPEGYGCVAAILSGGNVDSDVLAAAMASAAQS